MRSNYYKFDFVKILQSFRLGNDLHLQFMQQLVRRIMLNSQERMCYIHKYYIFNLLDYVTIK